MSKIALCSTGDTAMLGLVLAIALGDMVSWIAKLMLSVAPEVAIGASCWFTSRDTRVTFSSESDHNCFGLFQPVGYN